MLEVVSHGASVCRGSLIACGARILRGSRWLNKKMSLYADHLTETKSQICLVLGGVKFWTHYCPSVQWL